MHWGIRGRQMPEACCPVSLRYLMSSRSVKDLASKTRVMELRKGNWAWPLASMCTSTDQHVHTCALVHANIPTGLEKDTLCVVNITLATQFLPLDWNTLLWMARLRRPGTNKTMKSKSARCARHVNLLQASPGCYMSGEQLLALQLPASCSRSITDTQRRWGLLRGTHILELLMIL